MITPTVGRVVYFFAGENRAFPKHQPQAAVITAVHSDRCVNVAVFLPNGNPMNNPPTKVTLVQPGDMAPEHVPYVEWMPYQVKKKTGSESGEKKAGQTTI